MTAIDPKPCRIVRLTAENIKRLKAVSIVPSGAVVRIGGRNAQGKTSLMDCIAYALCGAAAAPSEPVRRGEKRGQIILETSELTVTRKFTAAGNTTLEVTNKEGLKYSGPQGVLDKLTATLAFDPLSFCRADKKAQFQQLQKLLGIDTLAIDADRKGVYDRRTAKNREVSSMKAVVDSLPVTGPARVDVRELLDELSRAEQANAAVDDLEREVMESESSLNRQRATLQQAEQELEQLKAEMARQESLVRLRRQQVDTGRQSMTAAEERLKAAVKLDVEPIKQRIARVEETNAEASKVEERLRKVQELGVLEDESQMMTTHLQELETKRAAMLSSCPMPVPGIGFEADGITLNGLPLDQASAAEQLRLGVAVACAMNPRMRVMLVRDGSLLDDDSMALLESMAEQHDAQIWVERVGNDDGKCTVVIEDGEAAAEVPGAREPAATVKSQPQPEACLY